MSRIDRITKTVTAELKPHHLEIGDFSSRHSGHYEGDSQSHLELTVISAAFEGQSRVNRHRLVNRLLADELADGLHALQLHTYSPSEWAVHQQT